MSSIIIVLHSLVSEGTPHMALDLCRQWLERGVRPVILLLDDENDEMRRDFTVLGIEIVSARLGGARASRFPKLAWATCKLVRRTGATGVVSMLFGWHAFIAMGAWTAGARTVAHVGNHPGGLGDDTLWKLRLLVRLAAPFTKKLVCCSDYVRDATIAYFGIAPSAAVTIYNGVAIDAFDTCRDIAPLADAPFTVTMVARLEGHKDQATLIRAAALLRDRGTPIRVRLVGDGTRRSALEALRDDLDVTGDVEFCGFRSDIGAILATSDVFAFSTTPDEGLGIALIEAMVAGVPIVASDVGACRETLDGGLCGLLVAPQDSAALADGIAALYRYPEDAILRANAARARAFAEFDAHVMAEKYLALVMD